MLGAFLLVIGALGDFVRAGRRRLRPWARWTKTVLASIPSVLNLVRISPIGLLISVSIPYLMLARKSTVMFAPGYQDLIACTPHIRHKTSLVVKVLLAVLPLVLGLPVAGAVISALDRH